MALYLKMFVWSYAIIVPNFKIVSQSARFEHQPLPLHNIITIFFVLRKIYKRKNDQNPVEKKHFDETNIANHITN